MNVAKTMAEVQLHARIKAFLDKNYPCCDVAGCCGEEEEAWAILDIVKAAGYGLVADAKREALLEAAEALRLQPPKLQAQYVGALLAYATEPWRLETKPPEGEQ